MFDIEQAIDVDTNDQPDTQGEICDDVSVPDTLPLAVSEPPRTVTAPTDSNSSMAVDNVVVQSNAPATQDRFPDLIAPTRLSTRSRPNPSTPAQPPSLIMSTEHGGSTEIHGGPILAPTPTAPTEIAIPSQITLGPVIVRERGTGGDSPVRPRGNPQPQGILLLIYFNAY